MAKKKSKHGGRRPRAGRPFDTPGDPTHKIAATLRESTLARLAQVAPPETRSRSRILDTLVNRGLDDAMACDDLAAAAREVLEGDPAEAGENLAWLREALRAYEERRIS